MPLPLVPKAIDLIAEVVSLVTSSVKVPVVSSFASVPITAAGAVVLSRTFASDVTLLKSRLPLSLGASAAVAISSLRLIVLSLGSKSLTTPLTSVKLRSSPSVPATIPACVFL